MLHQDSLTGFDRVGSSSETDLELPGSAYIGLYSLLLNLLSSDWLLLGQLHSDWLVVSPAEPRGFRRNLRGPAEPRGVRRNPRGSGGTPEVPAEPPRAPLAPERYLFGWLQRDLL